MKRALQGLSRIKLQAWHQIGWRLGWRQIRTYRYVAIVLLSSLIVIACNQTEPTPVASSTPSHSEGEALTIWWDKGFVLEEDEALQKLVDQWQQQTGNTVNLSLYTTDDLPQKAQRAQQAGNPPDIMLSHNAERSLNPHLAWQGKLVDVSDVIEPVKALYPPAILNAVDYYNNIEQKRSYYAVPVSQASIHLFYWRDLIQQAGFSDADIPTDWDGFWQFWKQVQDNLPEQEAQKIYGLGFSFSDKAGDTYYLFEQVLEAYDADLVSPDGTLQIDTPKAREAIVKSLAWYTQFYQQGYIPPGAETWLNPDNNSNLLNRSIVMTPNTSLSIPVTVREDAETYNKMGILEFPNKPSGEPTRHLISVKQAIIFADSEKQQMAKDFLSFFLQPEHIGSYLKLSGGRNLPVMDPVWNDPFWTNPDDPHLSTSAKTLTSDRLRPFYSVYHPAYSLVTQENVWGRAIQQIIVDGATVEQAANQASDRIKTIFEQWK
ncbi:MAG: ABC transporter substrate-binding protein [Elainellaceae cyanobacterium]